MIFIAADSFPCLDRAQDDLLTHESGAGPRRGRRHVIAPAPQVVDQVGANLRLGSHVVDDDESGRGKDSDATAIGADVAPPEQLQTRRHRQPPGRRLLSSSLGVLRRLPRRLTADGEATPRKRRGAPLSSRGARPLFQSFSDTILRLVQIEAKGRG